MNGPGRSYDGARDALSCMKGGGNAVILEPDRATLNANEPDLGGISIGPSEQNAVLVASGLSLDGRRVFIWAPGSPLFVARSYEQIRTAVAIPNLKVVILSSHDWTALGHDGAVGLMCEDIALMRVMPNMAVLVPSDRNSAFALTRSLAGHDGPAYVRLSMAAAGDIYDYGDGDFAVGGARLLTEGDGVTVASCGVMVKEALEAAKVLSQQGINAEVIDCYSIKPFPERMLLASVRRTGCCVVAEKHANAAGLYGAVTECLARNYTVPVRSVAIGDSFATSGTHEEMQEYYGLTHREIVHNVVQVWAMRRR
ncbi:MAG: transketolase [Synergistaceae bacterium]|nr:transketolase [Synergistaceae bacterium]